MMLPTIYNKNFEAQCIIDDYISFIWATRYYTTGDFELVLGPTEKALTYAKIGFYVRRDDDPVHVGIIEKISISEAEDGSERMIITGRFADCILARRIIAEQTAFTDEHVSDIISALITDAVISPEIAARAIPNFELAAFDAQGPEISIQYTGKNLLEVISDLCKTHSLGFYTTLESGTFKFHIYTGKDRTYDQDTNPRVIFSEEYGNLLTAQYTEDFTSISTDVLAAGEGEGAERKTVWVDNGSSPEGLERYEVYADLRNVQSNDGEISPEEYTAQLAQRGAEKLTTYTSAFAGAADFSNIRYKTDLDLGDVCVIRQTQWGIYVKARLVEVIESISEAGAYSITPSFSYEN